MKNIPLILLLTSILMLTLSVSQSFPENPESNFYYNPLLLNGKTMDITSLSTVTRGKLSMIKGDPESSQKTAVPFLVYLVRAGKRVGSPSCANNQGVTEVELSNVLSMAKAGDQLVLEPVGKEEKTGRRVIQVKQNPQLFKMQWFSGVIKSKDGC